MLLVKVWKYWFYIEHTKWNLRSCVKVISIKGLIFSHWRQEVNSVFPFALCFNWKNSNVRYSWFDQTIFIWCDEAWRWNGRLKLLRWTMHFREMFLSCTFMFSFTRCGYVFLSVPLEELQFDLHVFQRKITDSKGKRKISLAHASIDHAKTK